MERSSVRSLGKYLSPRGHSTHGLELVFGLNFANLFFDQLGLSNPLLAR
jgi:hypothetical protein